MPQQSMPTMHKKRFELWPTSVSKSMYFLKAHNLVVISNHEPSHQHHVLTQDSQSNADFSKLSKHIFRGEKNILELFGHQNS